MKAKFLDCIIYIVLIIVFHSEEEQRLRAWEPD